MALYHNFINPYHFIPLGKNDVNRQEDKDGCQKPGLFTGKMVVQLKTRTPLFIPDVHSQPRDAEKKHKSYLFFSYDDETPVIPGSSLRGMLRSNYEALTNSCLSVVNTKEKPKRRTSDYYQPGLLKRETDSYGKMTLALYPAERAVYSEGRLDARHFHEGQKVWLKSVENVKVTKGTRTYQQNCVKKEAVEIAGLTANKSDRRCEGYCYFGEPFGSPRNRIKTGQDAYFFYLDPTADSPVRSNMALDGPEIIELKSVLESYEEEAGSRQKPYQEYKRALESFLRSGNDYFPVWYSCPDSGRNGQKGKLLYLSCACVTKEIYGHSITDILKVQGKHQACADRTKLCPACRLFGMVSEDSDNGGYYPNAWGSSVRVQDAVLCGESQKTGQQLFGERVILRELASPKPSSTEFYLQKPEAEGREVLSWSYDYYVSRKAPRAPRDPRDRSDWPIISTYTPKIAGRKFYWHHTNPAQPQDFVEKTERNCTVTPLRAGITFSFPVYFEKITETQLKQLIWLCNISSEREKGKAKYGYKLGKGKPMGLGSVELTVHKVEVRRLLREDGKLRYRLEEYDYSGVAYDDTGFDPDIKGAFLRICDFGAVKDTPVSYPVSEGQSVKSVAEGFKWFGYNRFSTKGGNKQITTRVEQEFQQYMHVLSENSEIALAVNREVDKKASNSRAEDCLDGGAKANDFLPAAGTRVTGRVIRQDERSLTVQLDTVDPRTQIRLKVNKIKEDVPNKARVIVQIKSVNVNEEDGRVFYRGQLISVVKE